MAPCSPTPVRLRVRSALGASPADGLTLGAAIKCAVGQIETAQDSFKETSVDRRFVWAQGGAYHELVQLQASSHGYSIEVPRQAIHALPAQLSDEVTLLVNDLAAAIQTAKIVTARRLKNLAILVSSSPTPQARLLVWYLQNTYGHAKGYPVIHIIVLGELSEDVASAWEPFQSVTMYATTEPIDALVLDGCIDLCGVEASFDFATKQVEPLGTLVLLSSDAQAQCPTPSEAIRIDMNAVVVSELRLVTVGDFREELSGSVDCLSTHADALKKLLIEPANVLQIT